MSLNDCLIVNLAKCELGQSAKVVGGNMVRPVHLLLISVLNGCFSGCYVYIILNMNIECSNSPIIIYYYYFQALITACVKWVGPAHLLILYQDGFLFFHGFFHGQMHWHTLVNFLICKILNFYFIITHVIYFILTGTLLMFFCTFLVYI